MDNKPPLALNQRCRYIGESKEIRFPYGTIGTLIEAGTPNADVTGGNTWDFKPEDPDLPVEILYPKELEAWS